MALGTTGASGADSEHAASARSHRLANPVVLTQLPVDKALEENTPTAGGMLRAPFGDRARILALSPDGSTRVLTEDFHSACDPTVAPDGKRILFAGKRTAGDDWNIFEMTADGSGVRQITRHLGDCRSPAYQSTLYTITSAEPWYQITLVSTAAGTQNEYGPTPATDLYSCKLDGSAVRRLTFNLSSDIDPVIMPDGRLLYAGWQRRTVHQGLLGRVALFGINIDGTDHALFAGYAGRRIKHMPCVTANGLVVFVESDRLPWDGAGSLSCVRLRRPLHSYRPITGPSEGLFHSPSPLPDGSILVSRRPVDGRGTHAVYRFDPVSRQSELVFDDARFHDVQAKIVCPGPEPEGRSSVVTEKDPHGKLYCLNVYTSDLKDRTWMPPGTVKRLRVLEGVPFRRDDAGGSLPATKTGRGLQPGGSTHGIPPLVPRRILGEIPVEEDGSFHVEVPANTPLELQILDADGMALRSCGWIWAKNHEPRGCIGCHEDGELTPENWFVKAMERPAPSLDVPPQRRRTVDFRRDLMPIITRKCVPCHRPGEALPRLDGSSEWKTGTGSEPKTIWTSGRSAAGSVPVPFFHGVPESPPEKGDRHRRPRGIARQERISTEPVPVFGLPRLRLELSKYVHPGRARTSPLIWHLFGRNTSRPWDTASAGKPAKRIPPGESIAPTEAEKRTFVEWIDLGALWDGVPEVDQSPGKKDSPRGENQ